MLTCLTMCVDDLLPRHVRSFHKTYAFTLHKAKVHTTIYPVGFSSAIYLHFLFLFLADRSNIVYNKPIISMSSPARGTA